jgi:hypothetical protein
LKTPKAEKKTIGLMHSPDKPKSTKNMLRTPTASNLKDKEEISKTMKRNPTAKNIHEKTMEKPIEKSATKAQLNKSGTKSTFASRAKEKEKAKEDALNALSQNNGPKVSESGKKNSVTVPDPKNSIKATHPSRHENISATIGVETHNNDELLTKDDTLMISGFQDKSEINTIVNGTKLDYGEILDDRWSGFSKYLNRRDHIMTLFSNKLFGKLSVTYLITDVQKEILENEAKVKTLKEVRN